MHKTIPFAVYSVEVILQRSVYNLICVLVKCFPMQPSATIPAKMEEPVQLLTRVLVLQDGQERGVEQVLCMLAVSCNAAIYPTCSITWWCHASGCMSGHWATVYKLPFLNYILFNFSKGYSCFGYVEQTTLSSFCTCKLRRHWCTYKTVPFAV